VLGWYSAVTNGLLLFIFFFFFFFFLWPVGVVIYNARLATSDCYVCVFVCIWLAALKLEADYLKALMRRAQSYEELEKYEDALQGTCGAG